MISLAYAAKRAIVLPANKYHPPSRHKPSNKDRSSGKLAFSERAELQRKISILYSNTSRGCHTIQQTNSTYRFFKLLTIKNLSSLLVRVQFYLSTIASIVCLNRL